MESTIRTESTPDVTTRQSLSAVVALLLAFWLAGGSTLVAQIHDALDTHPPRWHLSEFDCQARVTDQGHLATGGIEGGSCETVTLVSGHGTEALLIYPIEPVLPIDDLRANVSLLSAKEGARIGLRVRYPYLRDRETRESVGVVIYGASYESAGEFASIGVGLIENRSE